MANSLLTPTVILREAGRVFHQKARVISRVTRKYSDEFAQTGAKVGASVNLRDANAFTVSDGATMVVQDVTEAYKTLTINQRKHVAMNFTSQDLTLTIDDFSERYIQPAVAVLVANIESLFIQAMKNKVGNFVDGDAAAFAYTHVAKAKRKLDENLTPEDGRRSLILCPTHAEKYTTAAVGYYNPSGKLGKQYDSGIVQDFTGFDIGATTHLVPQLTGTAVGGDTTRNVNGASESGSAITVDTTGSTTFLEGDVVTFAGAFACHPETKASLGYLREFTVTANVGAADTSIPISPPLVATGAKANVTAYPTNSGAVTKLGSGTSASQYMVESLAFHKDAFVFASVDLEDMSKYGGWGARETMDGVSLRIWRQGDIVNDAAPVRLDWMGGWLCRYPNLAVRIHADG